jgi:hypothetical protein
LPLHPCLSAVVGEVIGAEFVAPIGTEAAHLLPRSSFSLDSDPLDSLWRLCLGPQQHQPHELAVVVDEQQEELFLPGVTGVMGLHKSP